MCEVHHGELIMFQVLFKKNSDFHLYHTRQMDHRYIPSVRTKLAKSSFNYNGLVIWNNIYKFSIVDEIGEFVFSRTLRKASFKVKYELKLNVYVVMQKYIHIVSLAVTIMQF